MHPIFDDFSVRYKNVVFLRVDSDKNRHLSGEYGVTGLPTFVFVLQVSESDLTTTINAVETPDGVAPQVHQSRDQLYL